VCGLGPQPTSTSTATGPCESQCATSTSIACESQCAWTENSASCSELECDCQVIEQAGQTAFTNCLNCAEINNVTYADILVSISSLCMFTLTPTGSATQLTASTTPSSNFVPTVTTHSGGQKVAFSDGITARSYFVLVSVTILASLFSVCI